MGLLIYEGDVSHRIPLQGAMHEMHEAEREARDKDIAKRKDRGAPPDERTDFVKLATSAQALIKALEDEDVPAFDAALLSASMGMRGAPRALARYESDPDIDGVDIVVKAVSQKTLRTLDMRVHDAVAAAGVARVLDDRLASEDAYAEARDDFVMATVQQVMLASRSAITLADVRDLDALKRAGIFDSIYLVASRWQRLPPGKAERFGLPQPSTSGASTAALAQGAIDGTVGVTAAQGPSTSPAQSTPPIDARSDISSMSPTSSTRLSLLEQQVSKVLVSGPLIG